MLGRSCTATLAASRYRPNQQLIGAALFPFYVNTLKIASLAALGVIAVVTLMFWVTSDDAVAAFAHFWGAIWGTLFVVVGIVTVIFAAVERLQPKNYAILFDPRKLPPVGAQRVPRSTSAVELAFNLLIALWLLDVPSVREYFGSVVMGPLVAQPFTLGPWWQQILPAFLVVTLVHAAMNCVNLVRPDLNRQRAGTMAATHAFLLIVVARVIREHNFVMVSNLAKHPEQYAHAATVLNELVFISLACFALICAVTIATNVRLLFRSQAPSTVQLNVEAR